MSSVINGFVIFSLLITVGYFLGVLIYLGDYEENRCEMTYMFAYPQFVRIANKIDQKYPKYGLYAYSEGQYTEAARNMDFFGIPVFFIPGNAGSHKQVRSLSSIALRKAESIRSPFHFDYFTVDLNSEYSGLNGAVLYDQLNYVNHSIYTVLQLYKRNKNRPTSIVIFAHSMGGVIARRLVLQLTPNSNLIPIVLTLASPHKHSPVLFDSYTYTFYKEIQQLEGANNWTTYISVSGGYSDFLVPSYLTELEGNSSINALVTHVPLSWLPVDHICILWCKQLILSLNRALFDSVDPKTKQISTDPKIRKSVFYHHLVHHNGIKWTNNNLHNSITHLKNDGEWIESIYRQYTVHLENGTRTSKWLMVRLLMQPAHQMLTVVAVNLKPSRWAFTCIAAIPRETYRVCETFYDLSHMSEISSSALYKRRTFQINMNDLAKNNSDLTHVVFRILPVDEPVTIHFDVYNSADRKFTLNLPHVISFTRHTVIDETPEKAIHLELFVPELSHIIQFYRLFVTPIECHSQTAHATASLIVPWGNQNYHQHFTPTNRQPLILRLSTSKPAQMKQSAIVRIALDPACRYKISVQSSFLGVLGQFARFYSPLLVANIAAVILMTLNAQFKSLATQQECSLFFTAIKEGAKPYYILTSVKLIARLLSISFITRYVEPPDWLIMVQEGTDFFLLPLLLYICSIGIVWLLCILLTVSLILFEKTIHRIVTKFLAKTVSFTVSWSDYLLSALQKIPFVVVSILICLSLTTTGSLSLCLGLVYYFMKLTQLSQDLIEEVLWHVLRAIKKKFKKKPNEEDNSDFFPTSLPVKNAICFHSTIFVIWTIIAGINIPCVLTWAHNFKYNITLRPDSSFFPGFVLSVIALPLWTLDLPKVERKWYPELGQMMISLAVISLIYAPISIFRLNYTLTLAIVTVVFHQMVGPNREELVSSTPIEEESPDLAASYETVKAKLE